MQYDDVFIMAIIFFSGYKVLEAIIHRKERILLVDKLDKLNLTTESNLDLAKILGDSSSQSSRNWALRLGCLLLGIGFGTLVGYFIITASSDVYSTKEFSDAAKWIVREQRSVIYSSCTLLFGGLGLLASFFIERKLKDE